MALAAAHKLGVAQPQLNQNWLTVPDVANLLYLAGFEVMRDWREVLWPLRTPLVDSLFNKFLVRIWPFKHGALTNFVLARPIPAPAPVDQRLPTYRDRRGAQRRGERREHLHASPRGGARR